MPIDKNELADFFSQEKKSKSQIFFSLKVSEEKTCPPLESENRKCQIWFWFNFNFNLTQGGAEGGKLCKEERGYNAGPLCKNKQ